MKTIILYGMRGSGKTTVGKLLAQKLGYHFYDLDILIQEDTGIMVSDFVRENGWEVFRQKEHENLSKILGKDGDKILSLGGGTITFENNQRLLQQKNNVLFYIECPLDIIQERIEKDERNGNKRTSLTGAGIFHELEEVYKKRQDCYNSLYNHKILNVSNPKEGVNQILKIITH